MGESSLWTLSWSTALGFGAAVALVIMSALVERTGPIRLRHWVEHAGGLLLKFYSVPRRFAAFRFLLSLLAKLAPVVFGWSAWELARNHVLKTAPWIALAAVVVLLVALEWIIRYLVERHAENALEVSTVLLRVFAVVFWPIIFVLAPLTTPQAEPEEDDDEDAASDDEIEAYIDVGVREGILEPEEQELVRSIVDFGDTLVRSVMTPRVEIISVPADADVEALADRYFESKHSRLPLYHESIDHIVGVLHIRDLFEAMHRGAAIDVAALVNPPLYVPENKPVRDLLQEMQLLHQQMAIVVDEYGGVAGLVTVEDLVEEIVGEISDEHEPHETEREKLDEHRWRLAGRTYLEDLEDLFGLDPDGLPYETVSGLICGELGYVPKTGEVLEAHGLVFTVADADERRVTLVEVGQAAVGETA